MLKIEVTDSCFANKMSSRSTHARFDPSDIRRHVGEYLLVGDRDAAFQRLTQMALAFNRPLFVPTDTNVDGKLRNQSGLFDTVTLALSAELHRWESKSQKTIKAAIASGKFDYLLKRIRDRVKNAIVLNRRRAAAREAALEAAPAEPPRKTSFRDPDVDFTKALAAAELLRCAYGHVSDNADAEDLLLDLSFELDQEHLRLLRMRKKKQKSRTRGKKLADH